MVDLAANYDEIPYPTHARAATHPERMAVVARLAGLETKAIDRCRVLELGCGDGSNLIAMALALPVSTFLGIDIARKPVERGNAVIAELGLTNAALEVGDLAKLRKDLGSFDYIIAHGVYSWVPPAVQEALLAACRGLLAENGVALVSFNALPGGHVNRMMREMMLFHVRNIQAPLERVEEAKSLLGFLLQAPPHPTIPDAVRSLFQEFAVRVTDRSDADLFHDELATINEPVYLVQFAQHAAKHDLQFVGDADYFTSQDGMFPEEIRNALASLGEQSAVLREQYIDFIRVRQFRQTLLCRGEAKLDREAAIEAITRLYIASDAAPEPEQEDGNQTFASPERGAVTTSNALGKAAFRMLEDAFPRAIAFGTLAAAALSASGEEMSRFKATQKLAEILHSAYAAGLIELFTRPRHVFDVAGERPLASPLARLEAARGDEQVTTLRHEPMRVGDPVARVFFALLDGTRDRETLVTEIAEHRPGLTRAEVAAEVEAKLGELARAGVLLA